MYCNKGFTIIYTLQKLSIKEFKLKQVSCSYLSHFAELLTAEFHQGTTFIFNGHNHLINSKNSRGTLIGFRPYAL